LSDWLQKPIVSPSPWLKSRNELIALLPKDAKVIEIGAEEGIFSASILQIANPCELYLVDCWEEQSPEVYPENRNQGLQDRVFQTIKNKFAGNSCVKIIKGFSVQVAALFADNYFDWIYIDGNHTYEAVKADLEAWLPKIKQGGYITGHDYFLNGPGFGVVSAVNEFVHNRNLALAYLTVEMWPSYAVKVTHN
jgi:predicted O-methyltransferase YrrM